MRRSKRSRRDALLVAALAGAYGAFALTFRGPRERFWRRMTLTGLCLGTTALAGERSLRSLRFTIADLASGASSAAGLYVIFRVGDVMARVVMPRGTDDIGDVYALRTLASPRAIAARLVLVIGPAEELFWRGLVQRRLESRRGVAAGAALATAAYGGAHLAAGNATLIGAATVAGAYWSALAAAGARVESLIASHVIWDVVIFLIAPTASEARPPTGA